MGEIRQDEAPRSRWKAIRDFIVEWSGLIGVAGVLITLVPAFALRGVLHAIAWDALWLSESLIVVGAVRYLRDQARQDAAVRARVRWAMHSWGLRIAFPGVVVAGIPALAFLLVAPWLSDRQIDALVSRSPAIWVMFAGLLLALLGMVTFGLEAMIRDIRTGEC